MRRDAAPALSQRGLPLPLQLFAENRPLRGDLEHVGFDLKRDALGVPGSGGLGADKDGFLGGGGLDARDFPRVRAVERIGDAQDAAQHHDRFLRGGLQGVKLGMIG